jgi:galactose-1-phosphate uridylyltransferase
VIVKEDAASVSPIIGAGSNFQAVSSRRKANDPMTVRFTASSLKTGEKMEIKFERFHLQSDLRSPLKEFESTSVPTEVRIDPLTKRRSRIITWGLPAQGKFDFSQMVAESQRCFFCPENVFSKTPQFPTEMIPEGRILNGKAVGFPNLNPVGTYGSVVVLCQEHFLHLNQFTPEMYEEGLSVAIEIIRRTTAFDPDSHYWQISQNFLLPGGSSILHPHLQVIGDPIPTNEMEWLLDASSAYYQRSRTLYWNDLVYIEQGLGKRYITQIGKVHWFVSFAPIGFNEVCGSVEGHGSVTTLGKEEISSLAKGIASTLKYYDAKDLNSFNFSIYSISGEASYQLLIRIISRTPIHPYYLNDWTSYEVLQSELTSNIIPEELCRDIRPYFP